MALKLKQSRKYKYDGTEIYTSDSTQQYVEAPDGGWGTTEGGSINRVDRAIVYWVKFIDYQGTESYLENKDQYLGSFKEVAVAPGTGLDNNAMSMFTSIATSDGHHQFYTLPVEMAEPVGPIDGDIYYDDGATNLLYVRVSGAWVELNSTSYLPAVEASNASYTMCEELVITRALIKKSSLQREWWRCYQDRDCNHEDKKEDLRYLRNRLEGAVGDFYGGMQPTARKTIYQLAMKFCRAATC